MTIALVATGGTISSVGTSRGAAMTRSGAELLEQAGLAGAATVSDWGVAGSFALSLDDMFDVARRLADQFDAGVEGVIVTHGTDAMEETVFAAQLVLGAAPIAFTGAQRCFDDPAPDGPHNLRAAWSAVGSPAAAGLGPLVVFDDLGFQAHGVRKVDTLRSPAFDAPGRGPVLRMWGDEPRRLGDGRPPRAVDGLLRSLRNGTPAPDVPVVPVVPGGDGRVFAAVAAQRPGAVVLQAMGSGNAAAPDVLIATELLESGTPIFVTSRVQTGPVRPVYAGAGTALAEAGALFCDDLSPWQARVLASACLAAAPDDPAGAAAEWLNTSTRPPDRRPR